MYLLREKNNNNNVIYNAGKYNGDQGIHERNYCRQVVFMVFIRREDQASVCRKVKKLFDCLNLNKKYNTITGCDKHKKQ